MTIPLSSYADYEDISKRQIPFEDKTGMVYLRTYNLPCDSFRTLAPADGALMPGEQARIDAETVTAQCAARVQSKRYQGKPQSGFQRVVIRFHEVAPRT